MTDTGPGPKEPPFMQRALEAVEAAIATPVHAAEADLIEAVQKMHAAEIAAITHVQNLGSKVALIMKRFVGNTAVDAARAKLEGALSDFEAALSRATS